MRSQNLALYAWKMEFPKWRLRTKDEKLEARVREFCKDLSGAKEEDQANSGVERSFGRHRSKIVCCEWVLSKYLEQDLMAEVLEQDQKY